MRALMLGLSLVVSLFLATAGAQLTTLGVGPAGSGASAVTVDATGTEQFNNGAVVTFDYTGITVGTGNALVCSVGFGPADSITMPTGEAAVWDFGGTNQSVPKLRQQDSGLFNSSSVFGVASPTPGNKTLRITWTNNQEIFVACVSYNSVDQTTPFPNQGSGTNASTVNVTSLAGRMVQAAVSNRTAISGLTGTQIYLDNANGNVANYAANRDVGAATVAIGATSLGSFANQSVVATDIKAQ